MTAPVIMKLRRAELEARIEDLIDLLDVLDGDCDLEDNGDLEPSLSSQGLAGANCIEYDLELDDSDDEPSLGWTLNGFMGQTFDPDRELDPVDQGEPEFVL